MEDYWIKLFKGKYEFQTKLEFPEEWEFKQKTFHGEYEYFLKEHISFLCVFVQIILCYVLLKASWRRSPRTDNKLWKANVDGLNAPQKE